MVGAAGRIVAAAVAAATGLPHCGQKPAVSGTGLPHLAHVEFEARPSMDWGVTLSPEPRLAHLARTL